jgi:hypothetical protein
MMQIHTCTHKHTHRYDQLSPSMVERGDWGKGDDRRMLTALYDGGYEVEWDVPWGSLVEGRSEQVCVFVCVCVCV